MGKKIRFFIQAIEDNGLIEIFFYNEKTYHNFSTDTGYLNYSSGFNDTTTGNFYSTLTNNTSSMNVDMFSNKSLPSKKLRKRVKSSKIEETGRIGKGDKSNQRFEKVNVEFETYYFHNLELKLLPASQRAERYESQDVRSYCTKCGYRIRKNSWEFCPSCGNEL